jgi:hypothetical protein
MTKILLSSLVAAAFAVGTLQAQTLFSNNFTDSPTDAYVSGGGTAEILSMEVSNTANDLRFSLTVGGNVATTDWVKFLVGISTGEGPSTTTGNGWARPINMTSPVGGMNYWLGSWVDGGGAAQFFSYNGTAWVLGTAPTFSFTSGSQSVINFTVPFSAIGISLNDTIYFDAYTSGGGGTDSAIDALANPTQSITDWSQTYTSESKTGSAAPGIYSYTAVPEPSTYALLGLSALALGGYVARRRARK